MVFDKAEVKKTPKVKETTPQIVSLQRRHYLLLSQSGAGRRGPQWLATVPKKGPWTAQSTVITVARDGNKPRPLIKAVLEACRNLPQTMISRSITPQLFRPRTLLRPPAILLSAASLSQIPGKDIMVTHQLGVLNMSADMLSRNQLQSFFQLNPDASPIPTLLPTPLLQLIFPCLP